MYGKIFILIKYGSKADGNAISGRCLNHHEWLLTLGRCYCLFLVDVIAIVMTDVIVILLRQMLLMCIHSIMADVIAM